MDGGELRLQHPAGGAVVQSRHRQVFRHPQAQAEGGLHGSGGHHVVSAEDSRGPVLPGQQLQAGLCGTLHRGIAQLDVPGVCRQAVGLGDFQKGPVPLSQYIGGEAPCQHGDVPMTPADQVLQRLADPAVFVRHHAGNVQSLDAVVYQYHGQIPVLELCDHIRSGIAAQDHTLHLFVFGGVGGRVPVRSGGNDQLKVTSVRLPHDPGADAGVEFVQDRGPLLTDQEGDLVRSLAGHGPGDGIWRVVEHFRCFKHLPAGVLPDPLRIGERAGHGGDGNSGQSGDIIDGWIHGHAPFHVSVFIFFVGK